MVPSRMLTVDEVAEYTQISRWTLWKELHETGSLFEGRVPAVKLGGRWRIRRDAVEAITGPDSTVEGET